VAGSAVTGGSEPWFKALEPEITSAVRQAMGMMTGFEPTGVAQPTGGDPDMVVTIDLRAESGEFDLVVEIRCLRTFGVALCNAMLGSESSDVDNELLMSGVGEILNVVGGRVKNSCANRKIDVLLGLPELVETPRGAAGSFYQWEQIFLWKDDHCFRLGVYGMTGTLSRGGAAKSDAGITPSRAKESSLEAGAAARACATAPSTDSGAASAETAAPHAAPVPVAADQQAASATPAADAAPDPAGEAVNDKQPVEQTS
jgi:hypothetical protein